MKNNPIRMLSERLFEIAGQKSGTDLAALLKGSGLPMMGGGEQPADTVFRALRIEPCGIKTDPAIAGLLAGLIAGQMNGFKDFCLRLKTNADGTAEGGQKPRVVYNDYIGLSNMLLLSARLLPEESLFESLKSFYNVAREFEPWLDDVCEITGQLRQSLIYQQTGDSMEREWFNYIESAKSDDLSLESSACGRMLDGWLGLLWIPPTPENAPQSGSINMERAAKGMRALAETVSSIAGGQSILRYAVGALRDSYPASPELWAERFAPYFDSFPEMLKDAAVEKLSIPGNDRIAGLLPLDLKDTWAALPTASRDAFNNAANQIDSKGWENAWQSALIAFDLKPGNRSIQDWSKALQSIRRCVEPAISGLTQRVEHVNKLSCDKESEQSLISDKKGKGKRKSFDRLRSRDRSLKVVEEIDNLLSKQDYARAKMYFNEIVERQQSEGSEPEYRVRTMCGVAAKAVNHSCLDWAEDIYMKAKAVYPDDPVIYNGLADVYKERGNLAKAETLYKETIERWNNDEVARNGLAEVYKCRGDLSKAETLYNETIERWNDDVVARTGLAEVYKGRGDLAKAETLYKETIERWNDNVVARTGLAEVYKGRGNLDKAETLYRETIERWNDNVVARNGLAEVYKAGGNLAKSETLYKEIIERWNDDVVARNGLAEVYKAGGNLAKSETLYKEIIERWNDDVVARTGLAEVYKAGGNLDKAETLYNETIVRWNDNVVARNGLAEVYKARGNLAKSETIYKETIERWNDNAVARHGLANVLRKLNRHNEAIGLLPVEIAFDSVRNQYDMHLRAIILIEMDDIAGAKDIMEPALKQGNLMQTSHRLFNAMKIALELRDRRYDVAITSFEAEDESPEVNALKMHVYAATGREQDALYLHGLMAIQKIKSTAPDVFNVSNLIESVFFPDRKLTKRQPNQEEHNKIIKAEFDMIAESASRLGYSFASC